MINFGKITISIEDKKIYEVDIQANNDIRKKSMKDYLLELSNKFLKNNLEIWLN